MATSPVLVVLIALAAPGLARAATTSCGCVPTTHQVRVPDTVVGVSQVSAGGALSSGGVASASSMAGTSTQASSGVSAGTSAQIGIVSSINVTGAAATPAASASAPVYGGGGGFYVDSGPSTSMAPVAVDTARQEAGKVCAEFAKAVQAMRIEANCMDDKGAPHPASQTNPDKQIADRFTGEVYRCIAGTRMQYTLSDASGGTGRTFSCEKGEALVMDGQGQLACHAQMPARDCNERSLLRRYGPGAKLARLSQRGQCVAWNDETAAGPTPANGEIVLNGLINP